MPKGLLDYPQGKSRHFHYEHDRRRGQFSHTARPGAACPGRHCCAATWRSSRKRVSTLPRRSMPRYVMSSCGGSVRRRAFSVMHLVEPEEVGPIEGDDPNGSHRRGPRIGGSRCRLLFTLSVLVGVVVTIYVVLPARRNDALRPRRSSGMADAGRVMGSRSPTMGPSSARGRSASSARMCRCRPLATSVIGARRVRVLKREAAMMRLQIGNDQVTYFVQLTRGVTHERDNKRQWRAACRARGARQVHLSSRLVPTRPPRHGSRRSSRNSYSGRSVQARGGLSR